MPMLPASLSSVSEFVRRHGVAATVAEVVDRITDESWEQRLGVRTEGFVPMTSVGVFDPDAIDYAPIHYRAILAALKRLPGDRTKDVFVDFGCGKGRAVLVAATFPFRRVIGVELSSELASVARDNLARMKHRVAGSVEVVHGNAADFPIPADASVLYFFNPFRGDTLRRVVANIRQSLVHNPRPLRIAYFNPDLFDDVAQEETWIEKRLELPFHCLGFGLYDAHPPERAVTAVAHPRRRRAEDFGNGGARPRLRSARRPHRRATDLRGAGVDVLTAEPLG